MFGKNTTECLSQRHICAYGLLLYLLLLYADGRTSTVAAQIHTLLHPLHQSTHWCETPALSIIDGFEGLWAALTDMLTLACMHTRSGTHRPMWVNTAPLKGQGQRVHNQQGAGGGGLVGQEAIWQFQTHTHTPKHPKRLSKTSPPTS